MGQFGRCIFDTRKYFSTINSLTFAFLVNPIASNDGMGQIQIEEEETMSRRGVNRVVPILIALAFAMPFAARVASANGSKTTSATMDILKAVSVNGKQLQPGTYNVTADDSKVTLARNGKVVAEAPVQWKDENSKPRYSNIVTSGDQVTEIHFGGKMRYVTISSEEGKLN